MFQQPPALILGLKHFIAALGLLVATLSPVLSAASISAVGSPQVIGNSTDAIGIAWRQASVAKTNDADGDNILGSLGYWLAKTNTSPNESNGGFDTAQMTFSAPSWLTVTAAAGQVNKSMNYGYRAFQNPTAPTGKVSVGFMGRRYSATLAPGITYPLYRFTIGTGAPAEFRLTVATHNEITQATALNLAQVAGIGTDAVLVASLPAPNFTQAVFTTFRILNAQTGDVFELGARTTSSHTLMVNALMLDGGSPSAVAPVINTEPVSLTVTLGNPASFTVTATGSPLAYQWKKGGIEIPSATAATYTITSTVANDAGDFTCFVSNSAGSDLSVIVTLTVNPTPPALTGSTQWKNIDLRGMGFVTGILTHPTSGEIYARTDVAGIFRWNSATSRWIALLDDFGNTISQVRNVESFSLDPSNPNRLFVAYGPYVEDGASVSPQDGILRSDDKGLTWTRMNLPSTVEMGGNSEWRHCGERLVVDPANSNVVYFGSRQDGLWRSTDAGLNWTQIAGVPVGGNNGATRNSLAVNGGITFVTPNSATTTATGGPSRSAIVYLGIMDDGVYRSTDGGNTFALLGGTQPALGTSPMQGKLGSDGTLYVTLDVAVWRWRSNAWTDITPPISGFTYSSRQWAGLAIDPANPNRIAINATSTSPRDLFISSDAGATWIIHTTDSAASFPAGRHKAVTFVLPGWISEANQRFTLSGSIAFAPGNSNQIWVTTGFGVYVYTNLTATPVVVDNRNYMAGFEELVGTRVLPLPAASGGGVLAGVMDQSGFVIRDPEIIPSAHIGSAAIANSTGLGISSLTNTLVVSLASGGYSAGEVLASDDGGQTWRSLAKPFALNPSSGYGMTLGGDIAVSATDKNRFVWIPLNASWYPNDHPPVFSFNGGATWSLTTGLPASFNGLSNTYNGRTNVLAADTVNSLVFYAYYENPTDFKGYLYRSTDGGASWSIRNNGGMPGFWRSILQARPGTESELWYSNTTTNLTRSVDGGATFTANPGWTTVNCFGFGAPLPGEVKNTLYAMGTRGGIYGVYYSVNDGVTWVRPNGFGPAPLNMALSISGDLARPGRIYMASGGRGLFYVDLFGPANTFAPAITTQPASVSVTAGSSVSLSVVATGTPAPTFQWRKGVVNIPGATLATYTITATVLGDAGSYTVVATNSAGSATSSAAVVTITPATAPTLGRDWYFTATDGVTLFSGPANSVGTAANPLAGTQANFNQFFDYRYNGSRNPQAGDVVLLRGGVYNASIFVPAVGSGTALAPITLRSAPGETAILDLGYTGATSNPAAAAITLFASYWIVQDLEVTRTPGNGIVVSSQGGAGDNVIVRRCRVYNLPGTGISIFDGSTNRASVPENNIIEDCEVFNCVRHNINKNLTDWQNAIITGGDRTIIRRNYSHKNYGEGIIIGGRDNVARENVAHDNFSINIYVDGAVNALVERNVVYNTGLSAFYPDSNSQPMVPGPASGLQVANEVGGLDATTLIDNFVVGGRSGFYYGDYRQGIGFRNSTLSNNTFYSTSSTDNAGKGMIHFDLQAIHVHANSTARANLIAMVNNRTLVSIEGGSSGLGFSNNGWYPAASGVLTGAGDITLNVNDLALLQAWTDALLSTPPKILTGLLAASPAPASRGARLLYLDRLGSTAELVTWRRTSFSPTQIFSGVAASDADPDGDGVSNLLEYALGTSPVSLSSATLPKVSLLPSPNSRLQLTFARMRSDVIYAVEASSDLTTWTTLAINPGTVGQSVTVTDTVDLPTATPPRRFLRLRVALP